MNFIIFMTFVIPAIISIAEKKDKIKSLIIKKFYCSSQNEKEEKYMAKKKCTKSVHVKVNGGINMIISKKRIISLDFLDKYKNDNIKIGIHVTNNEYEKLGIKKFVEGIAIQPSPEFGINCNRNSNGYSFPDKTKPKEDRVINTIYWTWQDWGGNEHGDYFDISRKVYPRVEIPASNIEFILTKNNSGESFILANIDSNTDKEIIKQTINMFLEFQPTIIEGSDKK